jgi:transcriptional regulator of arginine metabolism
MKNERQNLILSIIAEEVIETQEQLIDRLRQHGVTSTQATVSRDIKQLHLIKEPAGNGRYRYAVSAHKTRLNFADRLQTILRESIIGVDFAQNLVVLKTMPGLAGAAGAAFDGMDIAQMVGSIAGDDTVLVIMRDAESAAEFCAEIHEMQKSFRSD